MEKRLHCPNCKSEELKFPADRNSMEYIVCSNCEYEFLSVSTLTKLIDRNEKSFSILVALLIAALLPGMYMLLGYSCLSYEIDVKYLLYPLTAIGFGKTGMLIGGIVFFVVSGIILWAVFEVRKNNNKLRMKRRYVKKHGYEE